MLLLQVLLSCIIDAMARVIRFAGMAGTREPSLPMLPSDEIQIHSTSALRKEKKSPKRSRLTLILLTTIYVSSYHISENGV